METSKKINAAVITIRPSAMACGVNALQHLGCKALNARGFTLIEVMIVVVIVAILAGIALPSYQEHVRKSRRIDARETLTRMAALQERFFFQNSRYSNKLSDLGGNTSPEGWYSITMTHAPACADGAACNNFTITATPPDGSPQKSDVKCATFSITQALSQTATGTDAANCW
jgi:type IV pilus assembly protein PilE